MMKAKEFVRSTQCRIPTLDDKDSIAKAEAAKAEAKEAIDDVRKCLSSHCVEQLVDIQLVDMQLVDMVIILAVNSKKHPWNNDGMVRESHQLLTELFLHYEKHSKDKRKSSFHTLAEDHPKLCLEINELISSTLRRDTWQDHGVMCALYTWYCQELSFPAVSDYLDVLLPPSLNLVDSYIDEMKVAGVQCLYHIMSQSGKAELRWFGRAQVIFDALQKLSYSKHEPLVVVLHPALIQILEVLGGDMTSHKRCEADEIYRRLLGDMYLEDKLTLRRSYAHCMRMYTAYLKCDVIKHLKQTMKIVLNYLEDSCGELELTRLTMLDVLNSLMDTAQPRVAKYHVEITKRLLRLVVDTAVLPIDSETRQEILNKVSCLLGRVQLDNSTDCIGPALQILQPELAKYSDKTVTSLLTTIEKLSTALDK